MPVGLYMDEHVARAITAGLRLRGVDVLTAFEDGSAGLEDSDLLDRAGDLGRVLFTQDDDLLAEASKRLAAGIPFTGIVYTHQFRATIGECVTDLEIIAKIGSTEELANSVTFLPL